MLTLSTGQRRVLADKLPDPANLAAGTLVFGQVLSNRPFSVRTAIVGVMSWAVFNGWALWLDAA